MLVLGPVLLVGLYRFVNPPVTLYATLASGGTIQRDWVALDQISPNLVEAAIASEDGKFCEHHGFDWAAIHAAMKSNEHGGTLHGASTISMQTAKNAFLWEDRTWLRKGLEAYFTVLIEAVWPKRRIMEVYLNLAQWGDRLYGAEAASERYFHVGARALSPDEAARLVAVLPNPREWSPVAESRMVALRSRIIVTRAVEIRESGRARCALRAPGHA